MCRVVSLAFLIVLLSGAEPARAQTPARPTPPTRDPHTPGYVTAKELPDGSNAPANVDRNFILGPTQIPHPR